MNIFIELVDKRHIVVRKSSMRKGIRAAQHHYSSNTEARIKLARMLKKARKHFSIKRWYKSGFVYELTSVS